MTCTASTRRPRRALAAAAFAAVALAAGLPSGRAHASICRADPVLAMRSPAGDTDYLHFGATINDAPSDVQSVTYTIHIPKDAQKLGVTQPSDDPFAGTGKETYTVVADNPSGYYTSVTTVRTGLSSVSTTAFIQVQDNDTYSKSGLSGRSITMTDEDSQGQQD